MKYYFLAAALPELTLGYPPDLSFHEFEFMLKLNLDPTDFSQVTVIRRFYDIQNIREFWKGKPLDERGNLDENALEDALLTYMGLPEYVYTFMDQYETIDERLQHFPELVSTYFKEEIQGASPFLKQYLSFERDWRLVLCGFRAKQLGRQFG